MALFENRILAEVIKILWTLSGQESACNAGDAGSVRGLKRSPGEGNGQALQCSSLEILWTKDTGQLQSIGQQRVKQTRLSD